VAAVVVKYVVIADWLFTTPTMIVQPATGLYMAHLAGFSLSSTWLLWSIVLYVVGGAAWLPVVWMQIRMRDLARAAAAIEQPLPDSYWRYLRAWVALGVVAFIAFVIVFFLMVVKPS
jgi:uncharacterized membrane protein